MKIRVLIALVVGCAAACAPVDDYATEPSASALTARPLTAWERYQQPATEGDASTSASALRTALRSCTGRLSLATRQRDAAQIERLRAECREIQERLERLADEPVDAERERAELVVRLTAGPRRVCDQGAYIGGASFHDCRDGRQVVVHTETFKCPDGNLMTVEVDLQFNGLRCDDPPREVDYAPRG